MATARLVRRATLDPAFAKQLDQLRSTIPDSSIKSHTKQSSKPPLHQSPIFKSLKHHPGQVSYLSSNDVRLPDQLRSAMVRVLRDHDYRQLSVDVPKFRQRVYHRSFPLEQDMRLELLSEFKLDARDRLRPPDEEDDSNEEEAFEEGDKIILERRVQTAAQRRLHRLEQLRTRLNMSDERTRILYLLARLAPEYAAVYRVLHELRAREPRFRPRSLLDFGSGVGSVAWVANALWSHAIFEHVLVDTSARVNELALALMKRGDLKGDSEPNEATCFPNVYTREFLPLAHKESRHDLVVSAFTLLELLNQRTRLHSLERLWLNTAPGGHLVLLENGTSAGFQAISEARAFLLNLARERRAPISLLAPCPHARECPLLSQEAGTGKRRVCAFESAYTEIDLLHGSEHHSRMLYSYLVFHKPADADPEPAPRPASSAQLRGPSPFSEASTEKEAHSKLNAQVHDAQNDLQTPKRSDPLAHSTPSPTPPPPPSQPVAAVSPLQPPPSPQLSAGATATSTATASQLPPVEPTAEFSEIKPSTKAASPQTPPVEQHYSHWSPQWPRLVCRDASLASNIASLLLCCPDGALRSCTFTRGATLTPELFYLARYSNRGDSLPIDVQVGHYQLHNVYSVLLR